MTGESSAGNLIGAMDAAVTRHPQVLYKMMHEAGPVVRSESAAGGTVVVASRAIEEEVLRHPELFSSAGNSGQMGTDRPLIPIEIDPPDQRKYRRMIDPLFAPQRMRALEAPIEKLVNELIDRFGGASEIDFAKQFSLPFPSQVFLTLIGLPLDDLPRLLEMKDGVLRAHHVLGTDFDDPRCEVLKKEMAGAIYDYFDRALNNRESERADDILSGLLEGEVDGRRVTRQELLDICFILLIGGLDTVSASLDCFFAFLAEHPTHRRQIVEDPSLIPPAIEELLRYEAPVMMTSRIVTEDTKLGECPVKAGDNLFMFHGASNTDEEGLPDAGEVKFDRPSYRHLSFGGGVHRCLGSNLARLELRTALRVWHSRIPDYRIKPGLELEFTPVIRTTYTFPMVLGASIEHELLP
ncbi:MAG: cytochrome P450 [Acidimicrobiales bacterium]